MNAHASIILAQQQQPLIPLLVWLGILIVVAVVGGALLMVYRRRLFAPDSSSQAGLLDDLRAMRDQGQISPEEYDAARKRMAARVAGVPVPPIAAPRLEADIRTAEPGFDLTGAPLPGTVRPLKPLRPFPPGRTPDKPPGASRTERPAEGPPETTE